MSGREWQPWARPDSSYPVPRRLEDLVASATAHCQLLQMYTEQYGKGNAIFAGEIATKLRLLVVEKVNQTTKKPTDTGLLLRICRALDVKTTIEFDIPELQNAVTGMLRGKTIEQVLTSTAIRPIGPRPEKDQSFQSWILDCAEKSGAAHEDSTWRSTTDAIAPHVIPPGIIQVVVPNVIAIINRVQAVSPSSFAKSASDWILSRSASELGKDAGNTACRTALLDALIDYGFVTCAKKYLPTDIKETDDPYLLRAVARLQIAAGNNASALEFANKSLDLCRLDGRLLVSLALVFAQMSEWEKSIDCCERAVSLAGFLGSPGAPPLPAELMRAPLNDNLAMRRHKLRDQAHATRLGISAKMAAPPQNPASAPSSPIGDSPESS